MIDGFREEEHVNISVNTDACDVDNRIFKFLYSLNQGNLRSSASDSCSEEVQVSGGYILVEGEVHWGIWMVRLMLDKVLKDVKYLKYSSFLYTDRECNVSHRSIGKICKVTHTCGIPNN